MTKNVILKIIYSNSRNESAKSQLTSTKTRTSFPEIPLWNWRMNMHQSSCLEASAINRFRGALLRRSQTDTTPSAVAIANLYPSAENACNGPPSDSIASLRLDLLGFKGIGMRVTKEKSMLFPSPELEDKMSIILILLSALRRMRLSGDNPTSSAVG